MPDWLDDEVAVVTGGASGNGRHVSPTLAEYGADVVVVDLQAEPREGGTPTHGRIRSEFGRQADFDADADEEIALRILRVGDHQLHLWNDPARGVEATRFAHFGVHVDDFEAVYRRAEDRDAFAAIGVDSAPPQVFEFNGTAQLYLRDPTGNLVEVDHPDIDALDRSVFADVVTRETSGPDLGVYTEAVLDSIR